MTSGRTERIAEVGSCCRYSGHVARVGAVYRLDGVAYVVGRYAGPGLDGPEPEEAWELFHCRADELRPVGAVA